MEIVDNYGVNYGSNLLPNSAISVGPDQDTTYTATAYNSCDQASDSQFIDVIVPGEKICQTLNVTSSPDPIVVPAFGGQASPTIQCTGGTYTDGTPLLETDEEELSIDVGATGATPVTNKKVNNCFGGIGLTNITNPGKITVSVPGSTCTQDIYVTKEGEPLDCSAPGNPACPICDPVNYPGTYQADKCFNPYVTDITCTMTDYSGVGIRPAVTVASEPGYIVFPTLETWPEIVEEMGYTQSDTGVLFSPINQARGQDLILNAVEYRESKQVPCKFQGPDTLSSGKNAAWSAVDGVIGNGSWIERPILIIPGVNDEDSDGIANLQDNCPLDPNPDQNSSACASRTLMDSGDEDWIDDRWDNCPNVFNLNQNDVDWDGIGDVCDTLFTSNRAPDLANKQGFPITVKITGNTSGTMYQTGNSVSSIWKGYDGFPIGGALDYSALSWRPTVYDTYSYSYVKDLFLGSLTDFEQNDYYGQQCPNIKGSEVVNYNLDTGAINCTVKCNDSVSVGYPNCNSTTPPDAKTFSSDTIIAMSTRPGSNSTWILPELAVNNWLKPGQNPPAVAKTENINSAKIAEKSLSVKDYGRVAVVGPDPVAPDSAGIPVAAAQYQTYLFRDLEFPNKSAVTGWLNGTFGNGNYVLVANSFDSPQSDPPDLQPDTNANPVWRYDFRAPVWATFIDGLTSGNVPPFTTTHYLKQDGDPFTYGVDAYRNQDGDPTDPYWYLYGEAYTNAGVYMNFDGVRMRLPYKQGNGFICVIPNPNTRSFKYNHQFTGVNPEDLPPAADGEDGYRICVRPDASQGLPTDLNFFDIILNNLYWQDTVKRNQLKEGDEDVGTTLNNQQSPASISGGKGAIKYKPITDLAAYPLTSGTYDETCGTDYQGTSGNKWCKTQDENGMDIYVFKDPISSYAPTSGVNVSAPEGLKPAYSIQNETFVTDSYYSAADKLSIVNKNQLKLTKVDYSVKDHASGIESPLTFTFGNSPLNLEFMPAIYLDYLYANEGEDSLLEFVGLPTPFVLGMKAAAGVDPATLNNLKLTMKLRYARNCPDGICGEFNNDLITSYQDTTEPPFEYSEQTVSDSILEFPGLANAGVQEKTILVQDLDPEGNPTGTSHEETQINYQGTPNILDLFNVSNLVARFVTMFVFPDPIPDPSFTQFYGALLRSEISYIAGSNVNIKYYSNKLPNVPNAASEAGAYISGNVFSQYIKGTVNKDIIPLYSKSDKILDTVRDAIFEKIVLTFGSSGATKCTASSNLDNLVSGADINFSTRPCVVGKKLRNDKDVAVYLPFESGDFKFTSSTFGTDLPADKTYILIVDGANVYIDNDVFGGNVPENLILVVLKKSGNISENKGGNSGNVFVKYDVKNVKATVFADGVVMSYVPKTGTPGLQPGDPAVAFDMPSLVNEVEDYKGKTKTYDDINPDVKELMNALKNYGYQLYWQGGVASRNTIGGASTDILKEHDSYLGKGNLPEKERAIAQLFDINYLRFFKLKLDICPAADPGTGLDCNIDVKDAEGTVIDTQWESGLPIDQQCKKGLTNEMIVKILNDGPGSVKNSITGGGYFGAECNGIKPISFIEDSWEGDLVPASSEDTRLSECLYNQNPADGICGLKNSGGICGTMAASAICQYSPIYMIYDEAPESFLFKTQ
ncbi:MAG: thrombospondin type 3 repeat-containing protein [Candidatus Gracilibacteria bacterium]